MSDAAAKAPLLDAFYQRYLTDETSARFVAEVSRHYTLGTLARLAAGGSRTTRRAAVLSIGFLGSFECNDLLGRALHDSDRVVRLLAENSIRELWYRDGSEAAAAPVAVHHSPGTTPAVSIRRHAMRPA